MTGPVTIGNATLYLGDCLDVLKTLPDASVDAVVTDPPYMIDFMGKAFDTSRDNIAGSVDLWRAILRVLKPGCHLLAFGATRTHHRLYCAIEDAGFRIVDTVAWCFGSGFPKHKTLLKPAFEPICLAAKPGKRWLNVDGCRIPTNEDQRRPNRGGNNGLLGSSTFKIRERKVEDQELKSGRFPANLIHDGSDEVMECFPDAKSGGDISPGSDYARMCYGFASGNSGQRKHNSFKDKGTAARFFQACPDNDPEDANTRRLIYCPKASKQDRDEGLEVFERVFVKTKSGGGKPNEGRAAASNGCVRRNHHPTVKPAALMRYLCRLITPPGGVILDPFTGSGSTGKAAMLEGFRFIGIEREPDYFDIARARIAAAHQQGRLELDGAA